MDEHQRLKEELAQMEKKNAELTNINKGLQHTIDNQKRMPPVVVSSQKLSFNSDLCDHILNHPMKIKLATGLARSKFDSLLLRRCTAAFAFESTTIRGTVRK